VVALGPVSKVLIHAMWLRNPNNTFIDIGSMMDALQGIKSRGCAAPSMKMHARKGASRSLLGSP
jgi:hypothetical protein